MASIKGATTKENILRMSIADPGQRQFTRREILTGLPGVKTGFAPLAGVGGLFGKASLLQKGGAFIKGGMSAIKTLQKVPFKTKLITAGGLATAGGLSYYSATGQSPTASLRGLAGTTAFAINPIGAISGFGIGGAEQLTKQLQKLYRTSSPYVAQGFEKLKDYGGTIINFPEPQVGVASSPSGTIGSGSVSFPVGVNIAGGQGFGGQDLAYILLALGLAGGGYALGRRRRKRRKYKKRRKR